MRVVWTDEARAELRAIYNFLAARSEPFALRVLDRLLDASRVIGDFPEIGRQTPEHRFRQLRELAVLEYRMMYHIASDRIEIIAVFHGANRPPF
jgi:plasmid stabilization system protein ParE